jgi:hypothetical protein
MAVNSLNPNLDDFAPLACPNDCPHRKIGGNRAFRRAYGQKAMSCEKYHPLWPLNIFKGVVLRRRDCIEKQEEEGTKLTLTPYMEFLRSLLD